MFFLWGVLKNYLSQYLEKHLHILYYLFSPLLYRLRSFSPLRLIPNPLFFHPLFSLIHLQILFFPSHSLPNHPVTKCHLPSFQAKPETANLTSLSDVYQTDSLCKFNSSESPVVAINISGNHCHPTA